MQQVAPRPSSVSGMVWQRAALLGFVAGLRSQLPLALLAIAARRGTFAATAERPLALLRSPGVLAFAGLAAGGELVADKLPTTPSRLAPGPLVGRLVFGGLAGAAACAEAGKPAFLGAGLGALAAGTGAAAGAYARAALVKATGAPDAVWAVSEDLLALGLGGAALR